MRKLLAGRVEQLEKRTVMFAENSKFRVSWFPPMSMVMGTVHLYQKSATSLQSQLTGFRKLLHSRVPIFIVDPLNVDVAFMLSGHLRRLLLYLRSQRPEEA